MKKDKKYGVWEQLFQQGFSQELYNSLTSVANDRADSFMRDVQSGCIDIEDDLSSHSHSPELDQWVGANDALLAQLVQDIQSHIYAASHFSLPAHDERQIMFKDAAEGLRFYQMEAPNGYKASFVIPMFAHDIGRLLEGRFYDPENNPHDNWTPHSKFSFLMLSKILEQPCYREMPEALKNHFLYAVLAHSGDNGTSYMSRAVQTCDRMQLIGAEGFYRALSYGTCLMEADIKYPDDPSFKYSLPNMFEHKSVLSILEYCARNMRENIGDAHQEWQRRIAVENVALLMMACDGNEELAGIMFAPEYNCDGVYGPKKGKIADYIIEEASELFSCLKRQVGEVRSSPYEVSIAAIEAIENPIGATKLSDKMKKSIYRSVGDMSDAERQSLFKVMQVASIIRTEQDEIDKDVCLRAEKIGHPEYIRAIASAVKKYVPPAPVIINQVPSSVQIFAALAPR